VTNHGTSGPMTVEKGRHSTSLLEVFLETGRELGYRVANDLVRQK